MYKMLVIGLSAGGMPLVKQLLTALPSDYSLPIALVAHLPQDFQSHFDKVLDCSTNLPVSIVRDKDPIKAGHIYIAPAGYHLLIEQNHRFALSADKAVKAVRPSIDVLFSSAAEVFENDLIAVILSGANSDGADGMAIVKQLGGLCIVLNPADTEFNTMPNAVINAVDVDYIVSIEEMISLLVCVDEK
ncbi:MAG: chemotaxis protein CheB [Methylococcales bacterium]|nr:chemotaxis protein CheB [Methylococcales bacterium]